MRTSTALLAALCAAVLLVAAHAGEFREMVTESPDHPRQCFHSGTGKFYENGDSWHIPGECSKYICDFPHIVGQECSPHSVDPPCRVVDGDASKPYPECCHEIKCP